MIKSHKPIEHTKPCLTENKGHGQTFWTNTENRKMCNGSHKKKEKKKSGINTGVPGLYTGSVLLVAEFTRPSVPGV